MGFRTLFRRQATADTVAQVDMTSTEESKHDIPADGVAAEGNGVASQDQPVGTPEEELHRGVQDIEAMTQTWSKAALIAVFVKYVFLSIFPSFTCATCLSNESWDIVSGSSTSPMRSKARSLTA